MTSSKVIVDIPEGDAERLSQLAANSHTNQLTALVKSIRVADVIIQAQQDGGEVNVVNPDGSRFAIRL